jgi:orotidine-5'-phosphate decarboxylase
LVDALRNLRDAGVNVVAVVSLTNRMEKRDDGFSVKEAIESEGFDFYSLSSSLDILPIVSKKLNVNEKILEKIEKEFEDHGVEKIKMRKDNITDRLMDKIDERQSSCIIGLDPQLKFIPNFIKECCLREYGNTHEAVAETFIEFCRGIIDATYDLVPAFKPNVCFYEKYGSEGMRAFKEIVDYVKSKDCIVIEDAKRNEVGESTKAYAEGHLGEVEMCDGSKMKSLDFDIMVVNPYFGSDGLNAFVDTCEEYGKGIFILTKTSNPSSGEFQDKFVEVDFGEGKIELYNLVAMKVNEYAQKHKGRRGYSCIGAVVGATYPEQAESLRKIMPNSFFLVPGYGAQGGAAKDIVNCFNEDGYGAVVNSSRGIIYRYREVFCDERDYAVCARKAIVEMNLDVRNALFEAGKIPKKWQGGYI